MLEDLQSELKDCVYRSLLSFQQKRNYDYSNAIATDFVVDSSTKMGVNGIDPVALQHGSQGTLTTIEDLQYKEQVLE